MKLFCFIFSFYLLVLSWQPCQDLLKPTNFHPQTSYEQTDIHDTEEQNESDDCSPFCVCSCCQTSFASNNFSYPEAEKIKVEVIQSPLIYYENPYYKNFNSDIWQPPKSKT